jgi:DNA invertase Pin-like site-specific DNA recombinase
LSEDEVSLSLLREGLREGATITKVGYVRLASAPCNAKLCSQRYVLSQAVTVTGSVREQAPRRLRAAQYLRMSTEHQKYSLQNQADAISRYAERHGFEVVSTFEDSGKSGLRIEGRKSLQRLIADVWGGTADFTDILVYDVSRWGRFQDADESAYYEFMCRKAGVAVHYCAEQFDNDGSIGATLMKSIKRVMAGEYSRELSVKIFAGQSRQVRMGFRAGAPAGYGMRRMMVDHLGQPKAMLGPGEQKSLRTDHVILVPGPPHEVAMIRRIFQMFVSQGLRESEIVTTLNDEGLRTDRGGPWTEAVVRQILRGEKYVGNNIYNRRSFKLKAKRVVNPPDSWVAERRGVPGDHRPSNIRSRTAHYRYPEPPFQRSRDARWIVGVPRQKWALVVVDCRQR